MIFRIENYIDEDGKNITAKIPFSAEPNPFAATTYVGHFGIHTPRGMMPLSFEFPTNLTLEQCFAEFEKHADAELKRLEDASRVIPASSMPNSGGLILPKG